MSERRWIDADGRLREETAAEQRAAGDATALARGVDEHYVAELGAEVQERGYVVIPDLVPRNPLVEHPLVLALLSRPSTNPMKGKSPRKRTDILHRARC